MHLIAELEADAAEVPRARRLLGERLVAWQVDEDSADTLLLLLSELVTNAVRHGEPPVHVHAGVDGGVLRVEVDDAGDAPVVLHEPDVDDVGGRGLQLVAMLSTTWGSGRASSPRSDLRRGTCVWFELALAAS